MIDYSEVLRACFSWYKDNKSLKYLLSLFFFLFSVNIAFQVIFYALAYFGILQSFNFLNYQNFENFLNQFFTTLAIFFVLSLIYMLIYYFVELYFMGFIIKRALEIKGINTPEFNFNKLLKFFIFQIWVSLLAITSWYNKKFLLVFLLSILLSIISLALIIFVKDLSIIGFILLFLGIVLFLFYCIVIGIYNFLRLSVSNVHFIIKDISITNITKEVWDLTKGKALQILFLFLIFFGILIFLWFVYFIFNLIFSFIFILINFIIPPILTSIISTLFSTFFSSAFNALFICISSFGLVEFYLQLVKETGAAPNLSKSDYAPQQSPQKFKYSEKTKSLKK